MMRAALPHSNYRAGLSKSAIHAYGMNPARFPGKFVPALPATVRVNIDASDGNAFTAGQTLIVWRDEDTSETFEVVKTGVPTDAEILIENAMTAPQIAASVAASLNANALTAAWFAVTVVSAEVQLKNTYNDPYGFNIPGASAAKAPTGTCINAGRMIANVSITGRNYTPGYIFAPVRPERAQWAPLIYYPPQ